MAGASRGLGAPFNLISQPLNHPEHVERSKQRPRRRLILLRTLAPVLSAGQPSRPCFGQHLIRSRADRAAEAYCQAIRNGESRSEADAQAAQVLYQGLHFSLYNTIVNILWDEFQDLVPEDEARNIARDILPHAAFLKREYDLNDDFDTSPEYQRFYTELVGTIQI